MSENDKPNTVVFISFENHYAPVGGLSSVMKLLPPALSKNIKTVLITPLFPNHEKTQAILKTSILEETELIGKVIYKGFRHEIKLYKSTEFKDLENYDMYLIKCDNFFLARENPYIDIWRFNALFHDSYFLSKCVPVALDLIKKNYPPPYILNPQDWETAFVSETMTPTIQHKCFITIHNPYDQYLPNDPQKRTVLEYTVPDMQGLSTVSEHFAYELQHDVLQKEVISQKLQGLFQYLEPVGINNGNFVNLSFPADLTNNKEILAKKQHYREVFSNLLKNNKYLNPKWGNSIDLMKDDEPIFLLFGRDDPKQKGFDVAASAIYGLLEKDDSLEGYFIFTPIPGPVGLKGLTYLKELATAYPEKVMVFPHRLSVGYQELQKAANYILMPSYYEPFGAANEGYASGTPVIARATGALLQQICPYNFETLPEKIQTYVSWYHDDLDCVNGFLFREHPNTETAENWQYLLTSDFSKQRSIKEPIDWRNPVYWSMAFELGLVLEEAISLYLDKKDQYCQFITNGIKMYDNFSWDKAAKEYRKRLYKI